MASQCRASPSFGSSSVSVSTTGSADAEAEAEVEGEAEPADVTHSGQEAAAEAAAAAAAAAAEGSADSAGGGGQGAVVAAAAAAEAQQRAGPPAPSPSASAPLEPPAAAFFPHLPPELLQELRDSASDQDLENRFTAISIAFKTDKLTLEERVAVQKRWRDQAELNMIQEENNLRAAIQKLSHLCKDSTSIEIVTRVKEQVDILRMAVDWVARSSESLGAIQQESRVSRAVDTVLQYVENLRRLQGRHDDDAKKRSKAQAEESAEGDECAGRTVRLRSLQALPGLAKAGSRRRASIAAIPRAAGGYPEGPRAAAIAASPLCTEGRSLPLPRPGSFPRRTSLTPPAAPSSPSTTVSSWGSTDNLDAFENAASALMDNIEEISESRRESCSSRLELEAALPEGNNNNHNNSVKQPCCDGGDGAATCDTESAKNAPAVKQMYLNYERCMAAVEAARLAALDLLEAETLSLAVRRVVAALLVATALCYLLATFFQGAEATTQGARR